MTPAKGFGHPAESGGFALLTVLAGLVVLSLLAAVLLAASGSDRRSSWAIRDGERAYFAAEAGANLTWATWPPAADTLQPGDSVSLGWRELPDGALYRAVIWRVDDGLGQPVRVLRVEGRSGGRSGGQRVIELWSTTADGSFEGAIAGSQEVNIANDALVDSYDSGVGPYGGGNIGNEGDVHSNGNANLNNNVLVRGRAEAFGSVHVGAATVTEGTQDGVAVKSLAPTACPAAGYTPAAALPPGLYNYNENNGQMRLNNHGLLVLPAGEYFFSSLTVDRQSELLPVPGAKVTIHLDGNFTVSRESGVNRNGRPASMTLNGCGTGGAGLWSLSQNSEVFAAMYAPGANVLVNNDSHLFGAIVGKVVTVIQGGTGPTAVHYDESLGPLGSGGNRIPISRRWSQIAR